MLPLLWLLTLAAPAHALTQKQAGPYVELGVGGGAAGSPLVGQAGGHLSVGLWGGTYDDAYSFGRYWSIGLANRVDYAPGPGVPRIAPMLEVRRGLDVFVANTSPFLAGGPLLVVGDEVVTGATARGGLSVKWRRSRFWGVTFRFEGGADFVADTIAPTFGLYIGGGFARPARPMDKLK